MSSLSDQFRRLFSGTLGLLPIVFPNRAQGGTLVYIFGEIVPTVMHYCIHIANTHLSPGVSLISDLVHDSGMLQSELFTSRSQNLVLAKLPNLGFWRYGQFFK